MYIWPCACCSCHYQFQDTPNSTWSQFSPPSIPCQPQIYIVSLDLPIPDISQKCNHIFYDLFVSDLFHLAGVQGSCILWHIRVVLIYWCIIFYCMNRPHLSVCQLMDIWYVSTFWLKKKGNGEEIPLVQGKEQWLHFAGAAVKRYPMPKVRETQIRW